ncbi:hypothetical protein K474DRAFT_1406718 [Panus rudis PR-1116 ss-1]|nr:hypothetical protein K474DRAFT_1406718 [Panus rudis PR-1116 ss-1]
MPTTRGSNRDQHAVPPGLHSRGALLVATNTEASRTLLRNLDMSDLAMLRQLHFHFISTESQSMATMSHKELQDESTSFLEKIFNLLDRVEGGVGCPLSVHFRGFVRLHLPLGRTGIRRIPSKPRVTELILENCCFEGVQDVETFMKRFPRIHHLNCVSLEWPKFVAPVDKEENYLPDSWRASLEQLSFHVSSPGDLWLLSRLNWVCENLRILQFSVSGDGLRLHLRPDVDLRRHPVLNTLVIRRIAGSASTFRIAKDILPRTPPPYCVGFNTRNGRNLEYMNWLRDLKIEVNDHTFQSFLHSHSYAEQFKISGDKISKGLKNCVAGLANEGMNGITKVTIIGPRSQYVGFTLSPRLREGY